MYAKYKKYYEYYLLSRNIKNSNILDLVKIICFYLDSYNCSNRKNKQCKKILLKLGNKLIKNEHDQENTIKLFFSVLYKLSINW